jgi:tetratricopeptide (TPR) repeat protein
LPEISARFDPSRSGSAAPPLAGAFALAAIPARYTLERQAWGEAAKLELRPSRFPQADAVTWFARGLGAARTGDLARAQAAIDALLQLVVQLTKVGEGYWANQVGIQHVVVSAWTGFKGGQTEPGLQAMRLAADREDRTEKNAITPGPIAPARELLGHMLLAAGRPADALAAFETTLKKEPNRFLALAGAAEAARQKGDLAASRDYARQLLAVAAHGDAAARPQLVSARETVGVK